MHLKPKMPSSMLTKLLRGEKDYEREYRGGARGGKDQFNWDEIRTMSYKDRECYLGYSSKIGFLDKGGKWRRRDWYKTVDRPAAKDTAKLEEVKRADEERLQQALGLRKREEKPEGVEPPKLNSKQLETFNKKIKSFGRDEQSGNYGLGFKTDPTRLKFNKPTEQTKNHFRLEGTVNQHSAIDPKKPKSIN